MWVCLETWLDFLEPALANSPLELCFSRVPFLGTVFLGGGAAFTPRSRVELAFPPGCGLIAHSPFCSRWVSCLVPSLQFQFFLGQEDDIDDCRFYLFIISSALFKKSPDFGTSTLSLETCFILLVWFLAGKIKLLGLNSDLLPPFQIGSRFDFLFFERSN